MHRCTWAEGQPEFYVRYHDEEWGVPVYDDAHLFEMLTLEGAQAGLSWRTVLQRRDAYRAAFCQFDIPQVASMSDDALEALLRTSGIIKNRLKVFGTRQNAQAIRRVQATHGSFDAYLWAFVDGVPRANRFAHAQDVPARTAISDALSRDLKKRGFIFVGSTIIYAYMQAIGMVNDHTLGCACCPPEVRSV